MNDVSKTYGPDMVEGEAESYAPRAECVHRFEPHVGIKVFNKKGMAWIQLALVEGGPEDLPGMWICVHCGAEGYVVPA